jgi:hypothetical protein
LVCVFHFSATVASLEWTLRILQVTALIWTIEPTGPFGNRSGCCRTGLTRSPPGPAFFLSTTSRPPTPSALGRLGRRPRMRPKRQQQ